MAGHGYAMLAQAPFTLLICHGRVSGLMASEYRAVGGPGSAGVAPSRVDRLDSETFEQVFAESPFPIQVFDAAGFCRRRNEAQVGFERVYGTLVGIGDFNVLEDPLSDRHGHAREFRDAYAGHLVEYEFSAPGHVFEGTSWFKRLLVPVTGGSDEVTAVVSIIIDVTHQKQAEEERARINEQLLHTQKLESLGVLAGGIAHDFNNLLVAVLGNASLLASQLPPDSPLREYADSIEIAARRAASVAHQMLAYSGKGRFITESIDITALLEETADLLRMGVSRKVNLVRELRVDLPLVKGDPTQIRQVVMNLLTNASESFGARPGRVSLRTGVADVTREYLARCVVGGDVSPGRYVFVEVADNGSGMTPDTVERVFDPFFTTKFTGRGLGLAAVYGIMRSHQGAIHVESAVGVGTTFRVLLPAEGPSSGEQHPDRLTPAPSARVLRTGTALVVDDDPAVRAMATRMLASFGFRAMECADGEAALEVLRRSGSEVGVVLLDLTMPRLDGLETLARMRAEGFTMPIILMSGYEVGPASEGRGDAALTTLQKPFSFDDLASALSAG